MLMSDSKMVQLATDTITFAQLLDLPRKLASLSSNYTVIMELSIYIFAEIFVQKPLMKVLKTMKSGKPTRARAKLCYITS